MKEKIMVLGAGIYQVPLIKKIKEMGYCCIVTSIPGNYPGFRYADKCYYIDTTEKQKILEIAEQEKISGIVTTGTDVAVTTIGYVCDKLHLSGITEESALHATNKAEMKELFKKNNVRTGDFFRIKTEKEAFVACEKLGYPVMFKCVDKSGSRGVYKVSREEDIAQAIKGAFSFTNKKYIIVEKYIEGEEIGVDGYYSEACQFIVLHKKVDYNNGFANVPIGHIFPYVCEKTLEKDIQIEAIKALKALKLDRVFFNIDVIVNNGNCYILEIGARAGATCIPELISLQYDINYYEKIIKNALGDNLTFPRKRMCAAIGELLVSRNSGTIKEIVNLNENNDNIDAIVFDYSVGEYVNQFCVGPDRIGHIIVHGENLDEAKKVLRNAKKRISVVV